jgi:hypothetical protein
VRMSMVIEVIGYQFSEHQTLWGVELEISWLGE